MTNLEIDILDECLTGNLQAFEKIVEIYRKDIYSLALKILQNEEDAADIVQETFLSTFKNIKNFRQEANFKTYLFRIVINLSRNFMRRKKTIKDENILEKKSLVEHSSPLDRIIKKENHREIFKVITALPKMQKEIVILRAFENLEYSEIGKIIGCSEDSAKSSFHFAIKNMRKQIKGDK